MFFFLILFLVAQTFFGLLKASKFICVREIRMPEAPHHQQQQGKKNSGIFIFIFFIIGLCSYRCSEEEGLILCFCLRDANVTSSIGVL